MKKNIILIYTDQHRYDALGCSGNTIIKTPGIDRLSQEGYVFDNCHVNCPLCVPSRVGLWTGRPGMETGSYTNDWKDHISPGEESFISHLKNHGYEIALVGKNHCFQKPGDNFDYLSEASHLGFKTPESPVQSEINQFREDLMQVPYSRDPFKTADSISTWCGDKAVSYLEEKALSKTKATPQPGTPQPGTPQPGTPFFLWLSFPDPHPPFMVSEPFASLYDDEDIPLPRTCENEMETKPFRHKLAQSLNMVEKQYPADEDKKRLIKTYWAMVTQIDTAVGRVLDTLEHTGLRDETIVVFTADHGDYLGDHDLARKGATLYECLTHVPLVFSDPAQIASGRSKRAVSNMSILPTLFHLAGIPLDGQKSTESPVLAFDENGQAPGVISHFGRPGKIITPGDPRADELRQLSLKPSKHQNLILHDHLLAGLSFSLKNDKWTYVFTPGDREELYDRQKDPHEFYNISEETGLSATKEEMSRNLHSRLDLLP